MNLTEEKTASLLASLWIRNRPLIEERLEILDHAAAAAAAGTLDIDSREEAANVAHKLAGSLGMYGYDHGTRLARQLELLLDYSNPNAARLCHLTTELRNALPFPEPPAR